MPELAITPLPIGWLNRHQRCDRVYSDEELDRFAAIIRSHGLSVPIVVDRTGLIVGGQASVEAAKRLGLSEVPCTWIDQMDRVGKSVYVSKLYRLALQAGWDEDLLACEVHGLYEGPTPEGIEAREGAGSGAGGLTGIVHEDALPEVVQIGQDPLTRPGDIWILGGHKLFCADPLDPETYRTLMGEERADLIFTDPLCSKEAETISRSQLLDDLGVLFAQLIERSLPESVHFVCTDWRHLGVMLQAGEAAYGTLKNCIVWVKGSGGTAGLLHSGHELVLAYEKEPASPGQRTATEIPGRHGADVWSHTAVTALSSGELGEVSMHGQVRPTALVADAINEYCAPDGIVLDAYCGSGTVLIAAERTGRRARAVEENCRSCDQSIQRWQLYTGRTVISATTGVPFGSVK